MKNIFRKFWQAVVLGLGISLMLASPALATANLTFDQNTTIDLSSPDINITILAASTATSLVVNAGDFTVVVPASGTFTVTSASRGLAVSGNSSANVISLTCNTSLLASLAITATSEETITVTPTSGQCSTGSGGGGGGGGGGASTAPVITSFTASPASITAGQSSTLSWNVANATSLSVNQGVGSLPSSATGTKVVSPTVTTTYTLTITNSAAQSVTATATVTIAGTTPAPSSGGTSVHPDGTLVLDGQTVYLIQDGQRLGFRDEAEYKSHGYNFDQVVSASDADKALPSSDSSIVKALEGTLVLDSSDNRTVYMIGLNNTKRGFVSAEVFKALGYSFSGLPKINLSDYTVGPVISNSTDPHPEGALVLDGQTVWWVLNGTRQGFESEAVFNTYGFSFTKVVQSNAADMALSQGPLVKFRDGTLVSEGGLYYLISDGKKLSFASASDLTGRGYKTSNAISASLTNYESGGNVQ